MMESDDEYDCLNDDDNECDYDEVCDELDNLI